MPREQCLQWCLMGGCKVQAEQALSVSLNKLGDLHYMHGQVQHARECYAQALQVWLLVPSFPPCYLLAPQVFDLGTPSKASLPMCAIQGC